MAEVAKSKKESVSEESIAIESERHQATSLPATRIVAIVAEANTAHFISRARWMGVAGCIVVSQIWSG